MNFEQILTGYQKREQEIAQILQNAQTTQPAQVYNDVERAFKRELAGIERRKSIFANHGLLPADWSNTPEPEQTRTYTITQPVNTNPFAVWDEE